MIISLGNPDYQINRSKGQSLLEIFQSYVVIDLETTGLDPAWNDIIEVAAIRVENGEIIDRFESLINPHYEIDEFITEFTGISNDMLANAPAIEYVLPQFLDFIGDRIVVGHNVNFDINFIYDKKVELMDSKFSNDFVDTMRLSRRLFKEYSHHRLSDLVCRFQIDMNVEHRALSDAIQTYRCYEYIKDYVKNNKIDLDTLISKSKSFSARDIHSTATDIDENTPIYGKTFAFTGTLEKMSCKQAMQMVVDLGGKCEDGVNKKVNFLVLGNNDYCSTIKDGKSSKQQKAEKLKLEGVDIETISENIFYGMIANE